MAIFNSYVSLPEGNVSPCFFFPCTAAMKHRNVSMGSACQIGFGCPSWADAMGDRMVYMGGL